MKITKVEAIIVKQKEISLIGDGSQDTVVIRVHTDAGITGIGEVDSSPYVVKAIIEAPASHVVCRGLADILLGEDPMEVEKLWHKMYRLSYYYGRRGAAIHAISGVDMALWDIAGKALNQPVHRLLGGAFRTKIPAYCSVLMPEDEKGIKAIVDRNKGRGFRGYKFGWGPLGQDKRKDLELCRLARKHVGDLELAIDIGMVWPNAKHALQMCRELEDLNLAWLEEPLSPDDIEGYKRLCVNTNVAISAGEELGPLQEFKELIEVCGIDVVQPDISRCGGITVAKKIVDLAMSRGLPVLPHAFKTGILIAASLQVIAAMPEARFMEYCSQETPLSKLLMKDHFDLDKDGNLTIPTKPGLGVEINEEVLERYRVNA
jgi:L-alanine-DL-glutamate epimerase-like enolase superfamily enzyme